LPAGHAPVSLIPAQAVAAQTMKLSDRNERILRFLGWSWAIVLAVTACFYLVENARGGRARKLAEARLAAAGESLDLTRFQSASVPPEENFCETPALQSLGREWPSSFAGKRSPHLKFLHEFRQHLYRNELRLDGEPVDWAAWRAACTGASASGLSDDATDPAQVLARAFDAQEAFFAELAQAALDRPHAQFDPPMYIQENRSGVMGPLEPFSPFEALIQVLELKARAALATGNSEAAMGALRVLWKFRQAMEVEPFRRVGLWVSLDLDQRAGRIVLDGVRGRAWSEPQLGEIQAEWGRRNIRQEALQAARWELADAWDFVDRLSGPGSAALWEWMDHSRTSPPVHFLRFAPKGWRYQHQALAAHDSLDRLILPPRDQGLLAWYKTEQKRQAERDSEKHPPLAYCWLLPLHWHPRDWKARQCLFQEINARQLHLTCALERHFLKHHGYPDSLDSLRPEFLADIPLDVDTQPLRYARDPSNDRYRLWSVGVDGVDDWGGLPPPLKPLKPRERRPRPEEALDWVLSFP
jgi:hypothetical protein